MKIFAKVNMTEIFFRRKKSPCESIVMTQEDKAYISNCREKNINNIKENQKTKQKYTNKSTCSFY